jgi:hypothetical protein
VRLGEQHIDYMVSFALPRFCDQLLSRSRKRVHYRNQPNWVGRLDTIVHELYHIDPERPGIRRMERADGTYSANCHGKRFFEDVVEMVNHYLATKPDPAVYDFLQFNFDELSRRFETVIGTTFRGFPSYPQRYTEVLDPQPADVEALSSRVEPMKARRVLTRYSESDLVIREFFPHRSQQLRQLTHTASAFMSHRESRIPTPESGVIGLA